MKYNELGNTGITVSEIGIGCEGLNGRDAEFTSQFIDKCFELGINCIDLYSPNPDLRKNLASALRGRRDKFVMQSHLCSIWRNGQYERTRDLDMVKKGFEDMLSELSTDYIDIGMIHYVDAVSDWSNVQESGILDYAMELKKNGVIKAVGMSSHNPDAALTAVESGLIDVLMFSINPCYDLLPASEDCEDLWREESYAGRLTNLDPKRERLYEVCQSRGVGITVMKAFGGGDLLNENSPAGMALTPVQCISYALTRPAVATVFAGAHSIDELIKSAAYETAADKDKDYARAFAEFPRISWEGHCMYCGHCAPCVKKIDIAMVTKLLNLAKAQNEIPETVREHYNLLEARGGDCIGCGACEKRCPFGVKIKENMIEAKRIFGS